MKVFDENELRIKNEKGDKNRIKNFKSYWKNYDKIFIAGTNKAIKKTRIFEENMLLISRVLQISDAEREKLSDRIIELGITTLCELPLSSNCVALDTWALNLYDEIISSNCLDEIKERYGIYNENI